MKYNTYIYLGFVCSLIVMYSISCKTNNSNAKAYYQNMNNSVDTIIPYIICIDDHISLDSIRYIQNDVTQLQRILKITTSFLDSIGPFKNETSYYNAAYKLVTFYNTYTNDSIAPLVTALSKNPDNLLLYEDSRRIFQHFYEQEPILLNEYKYSSTLFIEKYKLNKPSK